ncbi:hypothetical protein [Synechococcus sp. CS-1328]|uniref:hypothetical protein n=1 Tax=Synechococcus sp. CS-1328 TaxID=2847976 RepID=UPI00223BF43B|nr:hypothetical protein [Synechococcus sp. CS-1328]MCT0225542.1 hypothetical protein [Synechococcus sp. CS-1328]
MTKALATAILSPQFLIPGAPADGHTRRELGRQHMSAVMIYWLARNQWSHPATEALATWALNETGVLHTSQISHIRNGKMRMMGVKTLDAFGAINLAVWAYQNRRDLFQKLGTAPVTSKIEGLIKDAFVIEDPRSGLPLDQGGWMLLYLGYIAITGVVGGARGDQSMEIAVSRFPQYASRLISRSGKDFIEVKAIAEKVFPARERASKLIAVAAGLDQYEPEELSLDAEGICKVFGLIDGMARTPRGLIDELTGAPGDPLAVLPSKSEQQLHACHDLRLTD